MHRQTVVRLSATLMFVGRDRMSGIRRKLPLTSFASALPRHSAAGDRFCNGGTAGESWTSRAPGQPAMTPGGKERSSAQAAVISARRNPASSQAPRTLLLFLRAQVRTTSGGSPSWRWPIYQRRHRDGADRTTPTRLVGRGGGCCRPRRYDRGGWIRPTSTRWDRTDEGHHLRRPTEASPVVYLGLQAQRSGPRSGTPASVL